MSLIKFNVGTDSLTGKKTKYTNQEVRIKDGTPIEFIGFFTYHEVNDDPATPPNQTVKGKKSVEPETFNYQVAGKFIDSVTKLYVAGQQVNNQIVDVNGDVIPDAISVADYFDLKAINTFPGVQNADPTWQLIEGWCKEMIAIMQANGEVEA